MKQPTQHTINKPNPTQVCHPSPAVRRGIAIAAVAAITLVPTALVASRITSNTSTHSYAGVAAQPASDSESRDTAYRENATSPSLVEQSIVETCGVICDSDLGALWQQVIGASDGDSRGAIVADMIRSMLRAIEEAIVASAPALP